MLIKEADNNTKSATEREEINPIFKDVLTFNFGQLEIPIQTQVEVSRLPRRKPKASGFIRQWTRLLF